MPYAVRGPNAESKYEVINTETNEVKATHDEKEEAERQVRILEEIEHDPNWEDKHDG